MSVIGAARQSERERAWQSEAPVSREVDRPRPHDWPPSGPIDLAVHDCPHASSTIEWWYVSTHFEVGGRPYSLFASFFQTEADKGSATRPRRLAQCLTWAVVDVEGKRYLADTLLYPDAPGDGIQRLDTGRGGEDPLIRRALRELLARGKVPLPDRLLAAPGRVSWDRLDLDYDGNRFVRQEDGSYLVELTDANRRTGCRFVFAPR
jgi:hypothetical protein